MALLDVDALASAVSLYILPAGPIFKDDLATGMPILALGSSSLGYCGARLIARDAKGSRLIDHLFLADDLARAVTLLPCHLKAQADDAIASLGRRRSAMPLTAVTSDLTFSRPRIMGILNITPDSFSDGGDFIDPCHAVERGLKMVSEGADIIDIGGESTRPGALPVGEQEELDRVGPVIETLASQGIIVSIDTRHSYVMEGALKAGASLINDVSGLNHDPKSLKVAQEGNTPVILMHMRGTPQTMQEKAVYLDCLLDVYDELKNCRNQAVTAGISQNKLILDPGIGFAKRGAHANLTLLSNISLFHTLGSPLLIGASRKGFIGAITGVDRARDRVSGSIAVVADMVKQGVQMFRVHDVPETRQAVKMIKALMNVGSVDAETFQQQSVR